MYWSVCGLAFHRLGEAAVLAVHYVKQASAAGESKGGKADVLTFPAGAGGE